MKAARGVAVTGIGVVSPFGKGVAPMRIGLLECRSCLEPVRAFPDDFDFAPTLARVHEPLEVGRRPGFRLSRTDKLALVAARDAASECGALEETGIAVATTVGGLSEVQPLIATHPREYYRAKGFSTVSSYPRGHVADAIASDLGLSGPRLGLNVACASGAVAIALAARMILNGTAPVMLAGGADAICPFTLGGFHSLQALDPEPCRPFDKNRKGLNLGEGAAILALEDLERARLRGARIWAVLRGWGMTNDAFHLTAPHETGAGVAACIRRALEMAGASPGDIGYVNAHGTGTDANDVSEAKAYTAAFAARSRPVPVSSTKSYIGHSLGAAGAVEAVITMLSLESGTLFPTLRLTDPVESTGVDWLRGETRPQPMRLAMSVSAGFGGSNAALVLEREG